MKGQEYSFSLKSSLSELNRLGRHLKKFGRATGLSEKCIFEINLALDELFTNIISYGYQDDGEHLIKFTLIPQDEMICLCVEDDGIPFDPLQVAEPDVKCSIETCKIGGLGIHLIKKLMDEIRYRRCGHKNVLTMKKHFNKKQCNASDDAA